MRHKRLIYLSFLSLFFVFCNKVYADIDAIEAGITYVGDTLNNAKEEVEKALSLKQKMEQFESLKKDFNDAKKAVSDAKKEIMSAKQKAEGIINQAQNAAKEIEKTDVVGAIKNKEFAGMKDMFDGTKMPDEQETAVLEAFTRTEGANSTLNQNLISKAIDQRKADESASSYAKAMLDRQKILEESDDLQNPESVAEALSLANKANLDAIKRQRRITESAAARIERKAISYMKGMSNEEAKDE